MSKSLIERVKKFEELLNLILNRLEKIEKLLLVVDSNSAEVIKLANKFTVLFSLPAIQSLELASKAVDLLKTRKDIDEISKTIIEILIVKESTSISELTRFVKLFRGKASRRIVAERVRKLSDLGIVTMERKGKRVVVKLRTE